MTYLRGDAPASSLPAPLMSVTAVEPGRPPTPLDEAVEFEGILTRISTGAGPGMGFVLEVAAGDHAVMLAVTTWTAGVPDIGEGERVSVDYRPGGEPVIKISGPSGPVFYLASGRDVPINQNGLPLKFDVTGKQAYYEALTTQDLCERTVAHMFMKVRNAARGDERLLAPGESGVVPSGGRQWLAVAVDAFLVEESDCEQAGESSVTFFWMKLPEGAETGGLTR